MNYEWYLLFEHRSHQENNNGNRRRDCNNNNNNSNNNYDNKSSPLVESEAQRKQRMGKLRLSRLYLHKIVVPDASEDNEMKLNK